MKIVNLFTYKKTFRILGAGILMFYMLSSCGKKDTEIVDLPFDPEIIPSLSTDSLTMLISDSGIVKYQVTAAEQLIFDKARDPHYYFPEGVYVEQYDTLHRVVATLKADTAWNYTTKKLWRLKGNVFITNLNNETFSTPEVFWNEREQRVYSDKYIEINRPEKLMLKGFGFESNQNMTEYRIFKPHDTNIYVKDNKETNEPAKP